MLLCDAAYSWKLCGILALHGSVAEDARELCSVQERAAVIKTMDEANNLR